jgi:CubicO group peptidase (beta-lactamase class C family)
MSLSMNPLHKVRYAFFLVLFLGASSCLQAQNFPGKEWDKFNNPEEAGFSTQKLEDAKAYGDKLQSAALTLVVDGKIVYEWGEVNRKFKTHSIRKSFLSAMVGNYVKSGVIDLDMTMAELGVNDKPPLSTGELEATIRDCIKARSGVYHSALYESEGMKKLKPERYSERAGTHWYYNNWDFNVAGTVFTQLTGKDIFEAIETDIAKPIQMENYLAEDGTYVDGEESIHNAYPFRITSRDLARFGWLMLNNGNWNGQQVVPADWVEESTRYHSDATLYSSDGYGYMWWVARKNNKYPHLPNVELPDGTYSARGSGGHLVLIIPEYRMVIVHRADTDVKGKRIDKEALGSLVNLILSAKN